MLVPALRDAGLRIILSNMLTMSENLGLAFLSFCQQSSISWCSTTGQSMGAGSLKSCSMAFITWNAADRRSRRIYTIRLEQKVNLSKKEVTEFNFLKNECCVLDPLPHIH